MLNVGCSAIEEKCLQSTPPSICLVKRNGVCFEETEVYSDKLFSLYNEAFSFIPLLLHIRCMPVMTFVCDHLSIISFF
jgi:hypothetical protein